VLIYQYKFMSHYVKSKEACKRLGITDVTLRHWGDMGKINYIRSSERGNRLYDIQGFIEKRDKERELNIREKQTIQKITENPNKEKKQYIYCRVSSANHRDDLERQINFLKEKYPEHEVIQDIGSGINFKRRGFNKILADSMRGLVQQVVVAHKDRLCRIAWDHFNWLFKQYGVDLIVEDNSEYNPEREFNEDLFAIIHVFSSRHYGMRGKHITGGASEDEASDDEKEGEHASQKISGEKSGENKENL